MQNDVRQKIYGLFRAMKPGQMIIVRDFAKKDPAAFIQYAKDFIDEGYYNYEFTADYKVFRRMYHTIEELEKGK